MASSIDATKPTAGNALTSDVRANFLAAKNEIEALQVGNTVVDAGSDTTTWPMLARTQTGDQAPATDAGLTYNASTNVLTTGELSTNGTAGGLEVTNANSQDSYQLTIGGSMTFNFSSLNSIQVLSTIKGGEATNGAIRGLYIGPTFTPTTNVQCIGTQNAPTLNSGISPSVLAGQMNAVVLGASALGGTVTNAYGQQVSFSPNASATTGITAFYSFRSENIANGTAQTVSSAYAFSGAMASGTGRYNCHMSGTAPNYFAGDLQLGKTVTAAGTTGARTINQTSGTVNFAAAAASLVVTNSLVSANSIIMCTVGTNDATMKSVQAVAAAGSFTIYPNAAPTAETRVNFVVTN